MFEGTEDDKIQVLADTYPLETLLEQNDVEEFLVVKWLVDEDLINLNDYFYDDDIIVGESD
jgi:hypothetical protein